jgi:hypothetical protein
MGLVLDSGHFKNGQVNGMADMFQIHDYWA